MTLLNATLDAMDRIPPLTQALDVLAHAAMSVPDDTVIDSACGAVDAALAELANAVCLATAAPPDITEGTS